VRIVSVLLSLLSLRPCRLSAWEIAVMHFSATSRKPDAGADPVQCCGRLAFGSGGGHSTGELFG